MGSVNIVLKCYWAGGTWMSSCWGLEHICPGNLEVMAAFLYHEKMPLEGEREFLSRSVATTDTRYAAQVMRWEGKRENSVNSAAARERFVQLEPGEYLLECSSTGVHLKFDTRSLSSAGKHQQKSPGSSGWMRMVGSGARRLQPGLHLSRTRELLHCPQEGRDGVMPIILMWLRLSVPWSGLGGGFREKSAVLLAPWRGSAWCSWLVVIRSCSAL